ncbi:DNA-binding transcriptional regulator, MarR family [Halpernia humi]|uniref:HTH-type transcriptional regulator SarZ n=1 Tax=Halpernia humi TaxID=493375 RepID=A0A1H6AJ37_9FLAO|nr:MarR family transcriptional regulator [Halpernia humi]SEG48531.1 DNA-binding transcriptional regulator, MarR family [Halpernia humi]
MENPIPPKLENQICFPLYVISKEMIGLYRPLLEKLDITYSQYLVLMVLWEKDGLTVNQIGEKLFLDSGTITPLLKRLEAKKYISRQRKTCDERSVEIFLTKNGQDLKIQACEIPLKMKEKLNLTDEELEDLKILVDKLFLKLLK